MRNIWIEAYQSLSADKRKELDLNTAVVVGGESFVRPVVSLYDTISGLSAKPLIYKNGMVLFTRKDGKHDRLIPAGAEVDFLTKVRELTGNQPDGSLPVKEAADA